MDMIGIKEGSFEWALMHLKNSANMTRKCWIGEGVFVYLTTNTEVPVSNIRPDTTQHLFSDSLIDRDAKIKINSHIDMQAEDGSIIIGWCPSQVDMMANDWMITK